MVSAKVSAHVTHTVLQPMLTDVKNQLKQLVGSDLALSRTTVRAPKLRFGHLAWMCIAIGDKRTRSCSENILVTRSAESLVPYILIPSGRSHQQPTISPLRPISSTTQIIRLPEGREVKRDGFFAISSR